MFSPETIADMHIHSTASDGTMTPAEIVVELLDKDIHICSLTDHDSIDNQKLFLQLARDNGLHAIPGVEVSCKIDKMVYHILAYGFNPDDNRVPAFVDPLLSMMKDSNRELILRMSSDYSEISMEEYDLYTYDRRRGGWESVQYLYDKGLCPSPVDGLAYYRTYDCHLSMCPFPSPAEVIEEIHSWGAYAVLAHPNGYFGATEPSEIQIRQLFDQMKDAGIDGLEGYYPTHSRLMTETSVAWCMENDMILTAGCDSHGTFVPGRETGKIRIPLKDLRIDKLLEIQ